MRFRRVAQAVDVNFSATGAGALADLDLLTIRDEFLDSRKMYDHIVVHGHTPVIEVQFLANRINVDTGAFATNRLSCVRLDGRGTARLLPL